MFTACEFDRIMALFKMVESIYLVHIITPIYRGENERDVGGAFLQILAVESRWRSLINHP